MARQHHPSTVHAPTAMKTADASCVNQLLIFRTLTSVDEDREISRQLESSNPKGVGGRARAIGYSRPCASSRSRSARLRSAISSRRRATKSYTGRI